MGSRVHENNGLAIRKRVGVVLRGIPVFYAAIFWTFYVWLWMVGVVILFAVCVTVLQAVFYYPAKIVAYLVLAVENSDATGPLLPGYWNDYPGRYIRWCKAALKLGFPTLRRWLFEGFGSR